VPGIPKAAGTAVMISNRRSTGIIFEEASPLLASLQLLVLTRRTFTLPVKSFAHAVILKR